MALDMVRKSVTLPDRLWQRVAEYRLEHGIITEAETVRRLLETGLHAPVLMGQSTANTEN